MISGNSCLEKKGDVGIAVPHNNFKLRLNAINIVISQFLKVE